MTDRQPPGSKEVCDQLARAIASPDGGVAFRLLTRLQAWPAASPPRAASPAPSGPPGGESRAAGPPRVGIWQRQAGRDDAAFVRLPEEDGTPWAAIDRIEPKGRRRRVLLLGESAARGFLYDPHWTPAAVLQQILTTQLGHDRVDVVDLARTDIGMKGIFDLAVSAAALEPDACVIFAGNNWNPWSRQAWHESRHVAALLAAPDGWSRVRTHMEGMQRQVVGMFVNRLAAWSQRQRCPIVLLIPEFNLMDWRDVGLDQPLLPREAMARWLDARAVLDAPRATGDAGDIAATAAEQLFQLDGGTTCASLRGAALARYAAGDLGEARMLLERARDLPLTFPITRAPRCFAVSQDAMHEGARREGLTVVDLRRRFQEALDGALPDRRLFLDYCHLSATGVRVAMASAAERLVPMLGGGTSDWRDLLAACAPPTPAIEAAARLLAANHNFNWGQDDAVVAHHCQAALDADPSIADEMAQFVDLHTRRAPSLVCASFTQLARSGRLCVDRYLNPLYSPKRSKARLTDAMARALEPLRPGATRRLAQLRAAEHDLTERGVDLLDSYWYDTSYAHPDGRAPKDGTYKAFSPVSRFLFLVSRDEEIELLVVCRVPAPEPDETVPITINAVLVGQVPAGACWQTARLRVASALIREGLNTVAVGWPLPHDTGADRVERIIDAIDREAGRITQVLFPVHGEISVLRVMAVAGPAVLTAPAARGQVSQVG